MSKTMDNFKKLRSPSQSSEKSFAGTDGAILLGLTEFVLFVDIVARSWGL